MASITTTVTDSGMYDLAVDATLAHCDGMVYFLTECCKASATGTSHGVACRACYELVDERLGMAWLASSFVAEYPAWCASQGIKEGTPGVVDRYAAKLAKALGI